MMKLLILISINRICRSIGLAICICLNDIDEGNTDTWTWERFKNMCSKSDILIKINKIDYDEFTILQFKNLFKVFKSEELTEELSKKESTACVKVFKWLVFDYLVI
jgi:hypothetical protein